MSEFNDEAEREAAFMKTVRQIAAGVRELRDACGLEDEACVALACLDASREMWRMSQMRSQIPMATVMLQQPFSPPPRYGAKP